MDRGTLDRYFQKRVRPSEVARPGPASSTPADVGGRRDGSAAEDRGQVSEEAGSDTREAAWGAAAEGEANGGQGKGNLEAYFEKRAKTTARSLRRKKGCSVSFRAGQSTKHRGKLAPKLTHRYFGEWPGYTADCEPLSSPSPDSLQPSCAPQLAPTCDIFVPALP